MAHHTLTGTFGEEQEELRQVVRSFLSRHSTEADVRGLMATTAGYDPALWRRMGSELGLQGLAIPEQYGGSGFGCIELGIVFEEMGRTLLCAPYLATVALAAEALLRSGDGAACEDLLPGIAAGETVATLALTEEGGRWDERGVTARAERAGGGWVVTGTKTYVPDGHTADLVLVAARTRAGVGLFAVEAGARGLDRTPLPTLDQTRKQARLDFRAVPARLVGVEGAAWPVIERTLATAAVLLAAEQLGGAARALELAVEYAGIRVQYGRPIGSFQAIKHLCADMLTEVESARSAVYEGLWALADDAAGRSADVAVAAALAQAYCSDAYTRVAGDCVQIHGGIGFTWEHSAHLYVKRAKSSEVLLGTASYHRERLAVRLGL
ncbi:alkylation response protein AidB-like acyl-CoA dehydrogenase [Streptomyces sp. 846.5]|nr:acyl-CoA dehydrogenase family protein [Streptomyces sp. 846.5]TDU01787.1 alkylation response protein AidB-like acyl-CoA dehydrogenase [Streptomyces sp. 846.5]